MEFSDHLNELGTTEVLSARGPRNSVDPRYPYAFLVESEHAASGRVEKVATIFLTNRECPFRCLMCDLWKNTTEQRVAIGMIPEQIDYALSRLPPAQHIKLYNSGNFFDHQAIPPEDYAAIADRVRDFDTVIVENHPKLFSDDCFRFRDLLAGELEVAYLLPLALRRCPTAVAGPGTPVPTVVTRSRERGEPLHLVGGGPNASVASR